jgi:hypothetical protein
MPTSGTVSTTLFPVYKIAEMALGRCGIQRATITSEMVEVAQDNLFLMLSHWANLGVNLWTVQKVLLPLYTNQGRQTMPLGTLDILNASYRTVTRILGGTPFASEGTASLAFDANVATSCTQAATNGHIGYQWTSAQTIVTVGVRSNAARTYTLAFEVSSDGVTYTTVQTTPATVYTDGGWNWFDIDAPGTGTYFRIRETAGVVLDVEELVLSNQGSDIPMARLSRDDYANLTNKQFAGSQPLQFYFDRQTTPALWLWPVPNGTFNCLVVWRTRHIQDVGTAQNEIEVPQRWIDAVVTGLAFRMARELPAVVNPQLREELKMESIETFQIAAAEERDASPIYLTPNIEVYTR